MPSASVATALPAGGGVDAVVEVDERTFVAPDGAVLDAEVVRGRLTEGPVV